MRRRLLPLLPILLLAALLTPAVQDFIGQAIVIPLLYGYWIGRLLFLSIPQAVVWAAFFFIILFVAAGSLVRIRPSLPRVRRVAKRSHPERIESWIKLIDRADEETYYQWKLAQELRRVTLDTLAYDERLSAKEIQERLLAGQLDLPPEIETYLRTSLTSFSYLSDLTRRSRLRKRLPSPLDLDPERMIEFLEERLFWRGE